MFFIPVIVGSIRDGRQSDRVARFFAERLRRSERAEVEYVDLLEYDLPMMSERLRMQDEPPAQVARLGEHVRRADALVIVSPEYNHGYPGVLKNALDYFAPEVKRKPFGIVTVSAGGFGGLHCLTQLREVALGMGGFPIPAEMSVSRVQDNFDADGNPTDGIYERRAAIFIETLLWFTEAVSAQRAKDAAAKEQP